MTEVVLARAELRWALRPIVLAVAALAVAGLLVAMATAWSAAATVVVVVLWLGVAGAVACGLSVVVHVLGWWVGASRVTVVDTGTELQARRGSRVVSSVMWADVGLVRIRRAAALAEVMIEPDLMRISVQDRAAAQIMSASVLRLAFSQQETIAAFRASTEPRGVLLDVTDG